MDVAHYLHAGDQVVAIPHALDADVLRGQILSISTDEPGRREFVLELDGTKATDTGARGLSERHYSFKVQRGESWILVPCLVAAADAEAKAQRAMANEQKRIDKKIPLFASQIAPTPRFAEEYVDDSVTYAEFFLPARERDADQATELRGQVEALVSTEDFQYLLKIRERWPHDGSYGKIFWRKQLAVIAETGAPELYKQVAPEKSIQHREWLCLGAELLWTTPEGRQYPIKVQWIAPVKPSVMVKLLGEPFVDYSPKEFPRGNAWTPVDQLSPMPG